MHSQYFPPSPISYFYKFHSKNETYSITEKKNVKIRAKLTLTVNIYNTWPSFIHLPFSPSLNWFLGSPAQNCRKENIPSHFPPFLF